MTEKGPSQTAIQTAMRRAAHYLLDVEPKILADVFARALAAFRVTRSSWPWARLLRRVFAIEILVCERCGGARRILDAVTEPSAVRRLLTAARPRRGAAAGAARPRGLTRPWEPRPPLGVAVRVGSRAQERGLPRRVATLVGPDDRTRWDRRRPRGLRPRGEPGDEERGRGPRNVPSTS